MNTTRLFVCSNKNPMSHVWVGEARARLQKSFRPVIGHRGHVGGSAWARRVGE